MLFPIGARYRIAVRKPIANAFATPISLTRYVAVCMTVVLAPNMRPIRQE
jgi:hypothetical protein